MGMHCMMHDDVSNNELSMNNDQNSIKLIIIGIDGASWDIIKPLVNDGKLPFFKKILEFGCHGVLKSTIPSTTAPSWTSIFTGVKPDKHGITDVILNENGSYITATSRYRMVDSLWNILSKNKLFSIVINDPVTFPPEQINGIMTTGLLTPNNKKFCFPPDLMEEIDSLAQGYQCDVDLEYYENIMSNRKHAYKMLVDYHKKIQRVSLSLAKKRNWDVLSTILTSTDRLQHYFWYYPSYMEHHYRLIDNYLGKIIKLAKETNARILIISDHGFEGININININSWLLSKNYLHITDIHKHSRISSMISRFQDILRRKARQVHISRDLANTLSRFLGPLGEKTPIEINKKESLAVFIANGIYINNRLSNSSKNRFIKQIMLELNSFSYKGSRKLIKCVRRDELYSGTYSYRAPDIILVPQKGINFTAGLSKSVFSKTYSKYGAIFDGVHNPLGLFSIYGPNVSRGKKIMHVLETWDITPTILHLFNIKIPEYMDGTSLVKYFKGFSQT